MKIAFETPEKPSEESMLPSLKVATLTALSVFLLSACSSAQLGNALQPATDELSQPAASPRQRLYVDNIPNDQEDYIGFYRAAAPSKELKTLPIGKAFSRLAVGSDGTLYAAENSKQSSNLSIYNGASGKLIRTITRGIHRPIWLAVDSSETVYVANFRDVTVYPDGKSQKMRKLVPEKGTQLRGIAVDSAGDLFVATNYAVFEYAPGAKAPERVIASNSLEKIALGLDVAGDLYVASHPVGGTCDEVEVYAPGQSTPAYVIPSGGNVCVWDQFVAAPNGEVYAFTRNESDTSSVTAYAYGNVDPVLALSAGMKDPTAMAFDSAGNLYVSDYGVEAILVYAPGETSVLRKITQGITGPASIAISP